MRAVISRCANFRRARAAFPRSDSAIKLRWALLERALVSAHAAGQAALEKRVSFPPPQSECGGPYWKKASVSARVALP